MWLILCGCVKEDRRECPCRLIVDLTEVDRSLIEVVDVCVSNGQGFLYEDIKTADSYDEDEMILVPRDMVFLNVWSGAAGMNDGTGLHIPVGEHCPQVYMYSSLIDADEEYVREKVELRKNHCVMSIYIEGEETVHGFEMTVKGNVCGYDAYGVPVSGDFVCCPSTDDGGMFRAVIPRQKDSSLCLLINDGTGVIKTFAIGEYMASSGYDWTDEHLKDLTLGIDYSLTQISVAIQGWDEVYEFDVVI